VSGLTPVITGCAYSDGESYWSHSISNEESFADCVILDKEAFDPDAVFLEDIVDDDVLPRLSLAVDGLTNSGEKSGESLRMPSDETAANQIIKASTTMPNAIISPDVLEVYGWESSLWKKLRGYLGF
jgi:hypothetical protein